MSFGLNPQHGETEMGRPSLMFLTIAAVVASGADAQTSLDRRVSLEGRVVAMTPTFGIADQERVGAEVGAGWGVGLGTGSTRRSASWRTSTSGITLPKSAT
jgi:hypothetical protein